MKEWKEWFWMQMAYRLPKRLVYWCAVRVVAAAQMSYASREMGTLTGTECLREWE